MCPHALLPWPAGTVPDDPPAPHSDPPPARPLPEVALPPSDPLCRRCKPPGNSWRQKTRPSLPCWRVSWDNLTSGGKIQLACGIQIGGHQVQVVDLNAPIIGLRIQKIEEGCGAVFVGKRNRVPDSRGLA